MLGNEDQKIRIEGDRRWSNDSRSIPAELEPEEGCKTIADSQFCMPANAYLSLDSRGFVGVRGAGQNMLA